jgi:hypothetical protein
MLLGSGIRRMHSLCRLVPMRDRRMLQAHWTDGQSPPHRCRCHRLQEHSWRRGGRERKDCRATVEGADSGKHSGAGVSGCLGWCGQARCSQSAGQPPALPLSPLFLPSIAARLLRVSPSPLSVVSSVPFPPPSVVRRAAAASRRASKARLLGNWRSNRQETAVAFSPKFPLPARRAGQPAPSTELQRQTQQA